MHRAQLEHIIRAAAGITGATEIVIIGSQAVLGQFPNAPADLLVSIEADVFTFRHPGDADLIERFHRRRLAVPSDVRLLRAWCGGSNRHPGEGAHQFGR